MGSTANTGSLARWLRRLARATPVAWLVGLQTFRIGVELALALLYHAGVVPLQMTIEGRNWDLLVGLSAAPVAWLAARGRPAIADLAAEKIQEVEPNFGKGSYLQVGENILIPHVSYAQANIGVQNLHSRFLISNMLSQLV